MSDERLQRTKPGRKPEEDREPWVNLCLRINQGLLNEIGAAAAKAGVDRSEWVRKACVAYFSIQKSREKYDTKRGRKREKGEKTTE